MKILTQQWWVSAAACMPVSSSVSSSQGQNLLRFRHRLTRPLHISGPVPWQGVARHAPGHPGQLMSRTADMRMLVGKDHVLPDRAIVIILRPILDGGAGLTRSGNGADIRNRHVVLVIRVLCVGDEKICAPLGGWILAILGLLPSKPLRERQKNQVNVGQKYSTPT